DTVRHGIDGFRVPTAMAAPLAGELALSYGLGIENYDFYVGRTSQFIAVDLADSVAAFKALLTSPDLRSSMGAAGRQRAREGSDGPAVVRESQALWAELAAIRRQAAESVPCRAGEPPWPAAADPFHSFAAYPTRIFEAETLLQSSGAPAAETLSRL